MSDHDSRTTPQSAAEFIAENYYTEEQYCEAAEIGRRAARKERQLGLGPPFILWHRKPIYLKDGFQQHFKSLERQPVRSPARKRG